MIIKKQANVLSKFLLAVFSKLELAGIEYCVCGNYCELPYHTENDVDIWTKNIKLLAEVIENTCINQNKVLYLRNENSIGINFFIWCDSEEVSRIIHIDILSECRWRSFLPLVRSSMIESNRKRYNGFYVANDTVDAAMHLMYPLAHFGKITEKYKDDIRLESKNKEFWKIVESGWGKKFSIEIKRYIELSEWNAIEALFSKRKRRLTFHSIRQIKLTEIKSLFYFVTSNIYRLIRPNGLFIAFIGPDGCGKTTVLKNMNLFFEKGFTKGKIKKYYWRPFLFPRIKDLLIGRKKNISMEENELPSARLELRNSGYTKRFIHCIKLLYYCLDYIFGRIKYQGAWSRGGVVCFDRYWDDLLVFPERFGLNVPHGLVKVLGLFIPKPDIVFYLHAEPEILMDRKPELPIEEIRRQVDCYKKLTLSNNNCLLIDGNQSEEDVLAAVVKTCLTKMSERYSVNQ